MKKEFEGLENVLVFDAETTGLVPKKADYKTDFNEFPHIVQLAWWFNGVLKSYYIKPEGWEIPESVIAIHGITNEIATKEGIPFAECITEFIKDCEKANLLVGFNIYFDTSIVKANIIRDGMLEFYNNIVEPAMDKSKRIDMMRKTIKFVSVRQANGSGKFPTLLELYYKIFKKEYPAHNAANDVQATLECLPFLVKIGLIELKRKEYPAEQLEIKPECGNRKIEFSDPNPVTEPIGTAPVIEKQPEPIPAHVPGRVDPAAKALLEMDKEEF